MTPETETPAVTPDPNELHDPKWLPGESVTLRAGNRTWAMVQRANTAMSRAAIAVSGLSPDELKTMVDEEGPDALQALIDPLIDPVVQQLSIMRSMILRWSLPYPLTVEGLEQLPEEYGQPIWDAIEARKPVEVPKTPLGFPEAAGTIPAEEPVSVVREPGSPDADNGSVGAETNGVDVLAT